MNVLDKAEKALEYLKNCEGSTKTHELQGAASTLGRCLGALGSRVNYTKHYANLLHNAIPTLLGLASNDSAEVRLVGDEALNRVIVGGFPYVACKANVILQSQVEPTKSARWIRAALSRICLGDSWFRPGVGKVRAQTQLLIPKLTQVVEQTSDIQLIVEALESNLPRIMDGLADYTMDEEMMDLMKALLNHVERPEPTVRRGVSNCVACLCKHRCELLPYLYDSAYEKLYPISKENWLILGWFSVLKAVISLNEGMDVNDYLELYTLCVSYIEQTTIEHNIQNCVLECLTTLLAQARGEYKMALLEKRPKQVALGIRNDAKLKELRRNISSTTGTRLLAYRRGSEDSEVTNDNPLSILNTPHSSMGDLHIHTPDSHETDIETEPESEVQDPDKMHKELADKLQERLEKDLAEKCLADERCLSAGEAKYVGGYKMNIGAQYDEEVRLLYCARLLASKFLLTGNKGCVISDRSVRVSVKASALNCLSELLKIYPKAITVYLDVDAHANSNVSGSTVSEQTNDKNDYIVERNICYQDSYTESLTQETPKTDSEIPKTDRETPKTDSDLQNSLKDIQSNIMDSKTSHNLLTSGISDGTHPNSNFTSISNMTSSREPFSDDVTPYPRSSSCDVMSSSYDLEMKFDHFADSTTTDKIETKIPLKRTDTAKIKPPAPQNLEETVEINVHVNLPLEHFECQHMSDVFMLLENHSDPQIRGLVRICVASFLVAAFNLANGNYFGWKHVVGLAKDLRDSLSLENLVRIVLKGLKDEFHSSVNYTLQSLSKISSVLLTCSHVSILTEILNVLSIEMINYYLCKINLCMFYKDFDYERLFVIDPNYHNRCKVILDKLYRFLSDQDQKVRHAAADAIATIIPKINIPKSLNPTDILIKTAKKQTSMFTFEQKTLALDMVKDMYFYHDLPDQLKEKEAYEVCGLRFTIGDVMARLMDANCKHYANGLLETLHKITKTYPPWCYKEAYIDQGIFAYCVMSLDYNNVSVQNRILLTDICSLVYPVEIHKLMKSKTTNIDIFERDTQQKSWQHLNSETMATLCERFKVITLRSINAIAHLIEEVNPANVSVTRALPGSPVRRSNTDSQRRTSTDASDERASKKKQPTITSLKANLAGNFTSEPFFMKLHDNLRATYSNHKINLDPKTSIFYEFTTAILESLAIQLELSTEKEFGCNTEELLFYFKLLMPVRADKTVFCVTQLLKCLFGTNMLNQYADYLSIADPIEIPKKSTFYDDILIVNQSVNQTNQDNPSVFDDRRSSAASSASLKNPKMFAERNALICIENFNKNKSDRKWSTNKKELERYIRLFEPVVIQSLKSYTLQNDKPLQCKVLNLLNQLLTLRVNYCMLDSDQIFINFLYKQLDLLEQREIPDGCDLVYHIMVFLVQLSSSKHHTKQIIEVPKLIQLCDGLLASGATAECVSALRPVVAKVFSYSITLSVSLQREAAVCREVLIAQVHKALSTPRALPIISCLISLSQSSPENFYRWSELSCDAILNALSNEIIELNTATSVGELEKLLDTIYRDVLLDQRRVETVLKILFQAPPDQATTSLKKKLRYLSTILILIRKYLTQVPESETLLTINSLKSSYISPQSLFFNIKTEIDPLNVHHVNKNCANLPPDVVLVRFLFRTLTFVILEIDKYREVSWSLGPICEDDKVQSEVLHRVCVNLICEVKEILHLNDNCSFPLTAKTAQTLLHNEQSGIHTGLYSPEENIPLSTLNSVCLRFSHSMPLLTVHFTHLLIRLKFIEQESGQKLLEGVRNLNINTSNEENKLLQYDLLHVGCFLAYCEYFVENGLSEVVHLTWLLVNRIQLLISYCNEPIVEKLVALVHENSSASGLLIQAIAARCHHYIKNEFALKTCKVLKGSHKDQSGALVFLICQIFDTVEPSIGIRFANLAIDRVKAIKNLETNEEISRQLPKEDLQASIQLLQRNKAHYRYRELFRQLNSLASSAFDLSPLDLTQNRAVNPHSIHTTKVDDEWLVKQVKFRCCNTTLQKINQDHNLALLLSKLPKQSIEHVINCQDFDKKKLKSCFVISASKYIKDLLNEISVYETKELERQNNKREMEYVKPKDEPIDSNKMSNMTQSLQVFKRSDSKESKSQFFIPITENMTEKMGNLEICEEEFEITPPSLPDLFVSTLTFFDKYLTNIIKLFPKQKRPLSRSEDFNLDFEQSRDRYTKRCHEFFSDKLFYHEYGILHSIMTGYRSSLTQILSIFDEIDCDVFDKVKEVLLPQSLVRSLAVFSVISLQYMSFLIKNKEIVETPLETDVIFPTTEELTDKVFVDNIIGITLANVSKALNVKEVWKELNLDKNCNRVMSSIGCLFAIVKYHVKDTKPLIQKDFFKTKNKSETIETYEKLLSLIEYWDVNVYCRDKWSDRSIFSDNLRKDVEVLLVNLARFEIVNSASLIPPMAWSAVDMKEGNIELGKIDLPLQALEDLDILEAFLFRVHLIGWSSKKHFEEIWVALLAAMGGNGPHAAIRGMTQLLVSTIIKDSRGHFVHCPRSYVDMNNGMQLLRSLLVGTEMYDSIFRNVNVERIPMHYEDGYDGYHYGQFNVDYLRMVSDITLSAPYQVRVQVKRARRMQEVDVRSCIQLLLDIASQMLDPKAPTGLAARSALIECLLTIHNILFGREEWTRLACHSERDTESPRGDTLLAATWLAHRVLNVQHHMQEHTLNQLHQRISKLLASSFAPSRVVALHITGKSVTLYQHLSSARHCTDRISVYEQSLYWSLLFSFVESGKTELITLAVDFLLDNPTHYCADLLAKGITSIIRQQILPKDLKNTVMEKLLENPKKYSENHYMQILLVHLFSADTKLLSPNIPSNVSIMDPDVLMNSMERITLLYKVLRQTKRKHNLHLIQTCIEYFLKETLPPAAVLSRVVIEYVQACGDAFARVDSVNGDRDAWCTRAYCTASPVFEVFETAIAQNQLPVLSGWIFEALNHLLSNKLTQNLLLNSLTFFLIAATSNYYFRQLNPLCYSLILQSLEKSTDCLNKFKGYCEKCFESSFCDRKLLCVVALKSDFTKTQLVRLKELCDENDELMDLLNCLSIE